MKAKNNTVQELVARYVRNRHREEFIKNNSGIPEEVLVIVYFRRLTASRWWYAPDGKYDVSGERPRYVSCAPDDAKWYEVPVCPEKIKKINQNTRDRYRRMLNEAIVEHDLTTHKVKRRLVDRLID